MEKFSHGRKFELDLSLDGGATWTPLRKYLTDVSESDDLEQSDATTAEDDAMEYTAGQSDGGLQCTGRYYVPLDRIISAAQDRQHEDIYVHPPRVRYRPTGTGPGRPQVEADCLVVSEDGSCPVSDNCGFNFGVEYSDTHYVESTQ